MKYRIIAITLAAAACLMTLSGCKNDTNETSAPEEASVSESAFEEETSSETEETNEPETESETVTEAAPETTSAPETTAAPETTTAAPETTTSAPVTTTEPPTAKQLSASDIGSAIASKGSLFSESLISSSSSRAMSLFGIDPSWASDCAYYSASAAVAEEVLVINLSDPSRASAVLGCFESRKAAQIEDYEDYVPTEVDKIKNAVCYQNGSTLVFCVSKDASSAKSAIASIVG